MRVSATDHEITEAMIRFGGAFVTALGELFRQGDEENQRRLKVAFADYWKQYARIAALHHLS